MEQNQLTWYGHVQRMAEGRLRKTALKWMAKQKTARGRPKKNWMEGIRKAMNERNLNEGQWEDRKQWSLGVGQRRATFWNRHTYIHTYHSQFLTWVSIAWVAVSFLVTRGQLYIPNPNGGKNNWVMRCRYCRLLRDRMCCSLNVSQFATSGSFWKGTEGSVRDLAWVTGTWKTIDNCRGIEMWKIRDVRALGQDFSSERSLVQR